ncbi:winged helix-turn-helix domain-containing protein [Kribbella shirazensis]|uniref:Putative ArsR family transcriptional regulator n=1 Tax=Kribbella shirazensis TaxID=1105143 RepID=A0A7X6A3K9_9ACTN|nr:helix-turn-helix domain-containing protein [Kribbella shirazensis]NIK60020.1 putative ArsR family transcriptional regulator [Kribbella shirazensis]
MTEQRRTNRRDVVRAHPLRQALLELIDRDGTTTSTVAARELGESTGSCSFHLRRLEALGVIEAVPGAAGRVKPWRRAVRAEQATLNRELEDTAYASWLAAKAKRGMTDEDFAFSEVVTLADGELAELRARLHRVLRDFVGSEPSSGATTPTAVVIRAFPLGEE